MHLSPNNLVHALKYETTLSSPKMGGFVFKCTIIRGNRVPVSKMTPDPPSRHRMAFTYMLIELKVLIIEKHMTPF